MYYICISCIPAFDIVIYVFHEPFTIISNGDNNKPSSWMISEMA